MQFKRAASKNVGRFSHRINAGKGLVLVGVNRDIRRFACVSGLVNRADAKCVDAVPAVGETRGRISSLNIRRGNAGLYGAFVLFLKVRKAGGKLTEAETADIGDALIEKL